MASQSPPPRHPSPTKQSSQVLPEAPVTSQSEPQTEPSEGGFEEAEQMQSDLQNKQLRDARSQMKTPEPQTQRNLQYGKVNGRGAESQRSPSTPGHIPSFDWEEFESRYEQALAEANEQEKELLEDFDRLVKYFNVWASASSAHDNERGVKRLQTRQRYVKIAEQTLDQKKQHLAEVVQAFRSALALLSTETLK